LAAALGAVLIPTAAGLAQRPPPNPPGQVSIEARPALITWGTTGGIGGRASGPRLGAGARVVLEADSVPFDGYANLATGVLDATGGYSFPVSPRANTKYRVAVGAPRVLSGEVLVYVRMRVSLRVGDTSPARGQRVRFYGSVTPAHPGLTVHIQRRNPDASFRNVARATLTAGATANSSRYTGTIPISRTGVYRVLVPSHADHVTGVSALRVLRVGAG